MPSSTESAKHTFRCLLLGWVAAGAATQAADPTGSGPEPALAYSDQSLPTHTIYRPETLQGRFPVVLWGNGSCVDSNFGYREFLAEVASHGFIAVDPRIATAVVLNSGMMPDGDQYMLRHELERSILERMHAPIAYFIGGDTDIAHANSEADWQALQQKGRR